ncbi:acyltransferase family protein [Defluviimonas sp. SAOS-178_SWC]|uniref:acyltransferase family protein n=1 Tax=Defluviimonas sp. SAOS-178_SWC TaxID=3121287 RepID=UPI003221B0C0
MGRDYRKDIDGLRAVAVLPVVLYHAGLGFAGGYVGVDVFFVISGYLIVGLIHQEMVEERFSFLDFYGRRIRRLYPALFVVLAAVTAWAIWKMLWVDLIDYGRSLLSAVAYVSNIYFYAQTGYFTEDATIKPLLHTWSLAVEEQFYLVAPILLLPLVRFLSARGRLAVLSVLVVLSFAACAVATGKDRNLTFYLAPFRAWELGLGGLLALAQAEGMRARRWVAEGCGIAGLVLIGYAVLTFQRYLPFPGWRAAVPCLGAALVILAGTVPGTLTGRLLSLGPMTFVGKISYPLYLWHWPVIVAVVYGRPDPLSAGEAWGIVGASLVLATLTWRYVERPVRTGRVLAARLSLFGAAALASVAAACVAGVILGANGFPGRHAPELVRMVSERGLLDAERWLHDRRLCHFSDLAVLGEDRPCIRGAEGVAPSFAFVGDSHADAASPAVFAAAAQAGRSGWSITMPGFIFTPGRWHAGSGGDADVQAVLGFIDRHPEIRTVVVSAWWVRARIGDSYRNEPALYIDADYDGSGPAYNPGSFDRSLERLVAALPGREIVLLDDVPASPVLDVKTWVRRYAVTGVEPPPGIARPEADSQRAAYEPSLKALATRHRNVRYVPVFEGLCGPEFCPLFNADGQPVFRDGDHLSQVGALGLVNAMAAVFEAPPGG